MKHILLVSILVLSGSAGASWAELESAAPFEPSLKLKELASLPEGLAVTVKMVEFGYFVERNGQWEWPYGVEVPYTYTASDFEEMYDCPSSELKPGETYTDARNRSVIDCVPEQAVKWYFIGLDAQDNRVKGEAEVKLLAERAPSVQGPRY